MMVPARLFAALYDRMLAGTEEAGLRDRRRALLASARGRVIEIGAGTGANVGLYPDAVTELVLTEPEEPMARRLRAKAAGDRRVRVVDARADALPFDDGAFDTAVCTLVLCTVPDVERALAEIGRVLAPGGRLLALEHVRADEPGLARWQDRLTPVWRIAARGCHPNRDTAAALELAGFAVEQLDHGELPKTPPIARPLIAAVATAPSGPRPA
jgi:ubiquinone/menaquinone biosynthesis C-methylase UbiE